MLRPIHDGSLFEYEHVHCLLLVYSVCHVVPLLRHLQSGQSTGRKERPGIVFEASNGAAPKQKKQQLFLTFLLFSETKTIGYFVRDAQVQKGDPLYRECHLRSRPFQQQR